MTPDSGLLFWAMHPVHMARIHPSNFFTYFILWQCILTMKSTSCRLLKWCNNIVSYELLWARIVHVTIGQLQLNVHYIACCLQYMGLGLGLGLGLDLLYLVGQQLCTRICNTFRIVTLLYLFFAQFAKCRDYALLWFVFSLTIY